MRYGLISDVHANLTALKAVMTAAQAESIDGYLCAGDLVGYGPEPNECVRLLADIGARCVAGNHDRMAVGALGDAHASHLARRSLAWTRSVLRDETMDYLAALPDEMMVERWILVTHGAPGDVEARIRAADGRAALHRLSVSHPPAQLLIVGNTHHAMAVSDDGRSWPLTSPVMLSAGARFVINPGSVGQSREALPLARFGLLDTERGQVEFRAIEYDVESARKAFLAVGLPTRGLHRQARRWGRIERARRAVRHRLSGDRPRPGDSPRPGQEAS